MRRGRRRRAGGRPSCTAPAPPSPSSTPAPHTTTTRNIRSARDEIKIGVEIWRRRRKQIAHRVGGQRRPSGGVERGHHQRVGHAAPPLPAPSPERRHEGRRRRRRSGGLRRGRVRVRVPLLLRRRRGRRIEDVGEGQPRGAVDREPVRLPSAAPRHRRSWRSSAAQADRILSDFRVRLGLLNRMRNPTVSSEHPGLFRFAEKKPGNIGSTFGFGRRKSAARHLACRMYTPAARRPTGIAAELHDDEEGRASHRVCAGLLLTSLLQKSCFC